MPNVGVRCLYFEAAVPKTVSSVYTIGLTPLFHPRRPCCLRFSTRADEAARCHRCWPSYLLLLHLRQLPLGTQDALAPEVRIGTVQGEQLIVCALLLNGPRRIQNDDLIGHLDGLQLVGDGNHRR